MPIARPQNVAGQTGQDLYRAGAPIFITTQKGDVDKLAASCDGDASMLFRRLRVYNFTARVPGPPAAVPEFAIALLSFCARTMSKQRPRVAASDSG